VVILNWNQVVTLNWNWVVNITGICSKEAWGKKFAHGVLICFLKEFAVAGGRSGASCEAYVFFLKTVPVIFFGALAKE
jgi:hypothetical protein